MKPTWDRLGRAIASTALAVLSVLAPARALAQTPENVAVVINENSAASQLIGEHYVKSRGIPASNVLRIRTVTDETVNREVFVKTIEQPLAAAIAREGMHDRILYVVLTKGVPLLIEGTGGLEGTVASVDSELTLLYRRMTGIGAPVAGPIPNPYFLGDREIAEASRFTRRAHDIYLVSRLDAFTATEAMELVDRALATEGEGRIVLHQRGSLDANVLGEGWLAAASKRLQAQGHGDRVLFDTARNSPGTAPVLGYYSWGSLDPQLLTRQAGVRFVPGALAATYVGTSARTLTAPPPEWMPSQSADRATWFAGMPHGLVGDLIREGATGAAGYVWEPYMQGAVRADILFPAYLAGFNLIEAFYLATPVLSWQTVIIGDPLCAPFDREPIGRTDIDGGTDGVTELPVFFSARRGEVLRRSLDATPEVIRLILRSESRFLHGDIAGGRQALEEASLGAPTVTALHRQLASLAEQAGDVDAALARYRRIVDLEPDDARALNNLAYGLAVHKNAPAEARPLAQRAVAVARDNPAMLDTLGWIEYLLGNHAEAVRLLTDAVKRAPSSAEIRLHTAHALVATGDLASARVQLDVALQLNPSLAGRADVRELRDGLD